jgi:hypothetical protein
MGVGTKTGIWGFQCHGEVPLSRRWAATQFGPSWARWRNTGVTAYCMVTYESMPGREVHSGCDLSTHSPEYDFT